MLSLPERILRFDYRGHEVSFYVPDAYADFIQQHLLVERTFFEVDELEWVRERMDLSGRVTVDIGANIGNHSVFFAEICGATRCIAFEPLPHAHSVLQRNAEMNGGGAIQPQAIALTDRHTTVSIAKTAITNVGGTRFREGGPDGFSAVPLDSLEISTIDLIKIDVEGMAAKVLVGGRETLTLTRPPVMIEFFGKEAEQCEVELSRLGYRRTHDFGYGTFFYEWSANNRP
jgi:FkbM family methyltransferase